MKRRYDLKAETIKALEEFIDELARQGADDPQEEDDHYYTKAYRRGLLRLAKKENEGRRFMDVAMADRALAAEVLSEKHQSGRAKGESRPSDYHPALRACLEGAALEIGWMKDIWKTAPVKGDIALAIKIASERWGVTQAEIIKFRKRRKKPRTKSQPK